MMMFLYILMVVAAAGMLFGNHKYKSKGVAWGRPLAGACGVFALLLAIVIIGAHLFNVGDKVRINSIIEKELKYFDAKMQYLADYLEEEHGDADYLLITNEQTEYNAERRKVMMDALEGLSIVTTFEVTPPEEMEEYVETDMYLTAERFDGIISRYPEADIVISMLGLPMDYAEMKLWRQKEWEDEYNRKPPSLVLVDAYVYDLKKAISAGAIAAVVQYRPDAEYKPDDPVPSSIEEAFAKRYILITPENVDEMDQKYEGLFME